MAKSPSIRLLQDPPMNGPANMAFDEALLTLVGEGGSPPTLRLYQWREPTISLGYFQCYADYEALPAPQRDCSVVRRLTGGGAILHDLELTYALVLPLDHPLLHGGPNELYVLMHETLIACAERIHMEASMAGISDDSGPTRGPFFCFARRHRFDVLVNHEKLAGSAQRRTRQAVLQHGSMILASRFACQPTIASPLAFDEAIALVRKELPQRFTHRTRYETREDNWLPTERKLAEDLQAKYTGELWTKRR